LNENEDHIYVAIGFVTGSTCIGALVENNPMSIVMSNPIMITTGVDESDDGLVERLVMNRFCYLTDDQFFTFSKKDILFCSTLKRSLIEPYKKLCSTFNGTEQDEDRLNLNEIPFIHSGSSTLN